MDESKVREHAEAHGRAIVEGDLARAGSDLNEAARAKAPGVMKRLPRPAIAAEIDSVETAADAYRVLIRYRGEDAAVVVETRWAEIDGRPQIVDLEVI